MWSQEIPVSGDKMKDTRLLKVLQKIFISSVWKFISRNILVNVLFIQAGIITNLNTL